MQLDRSNEATQSVASPSSESNLVSVAKTPVRVVEDDLVLILYFGNSLFAVMLPKDKAFSVCYKQRERERERGIFLVETNEGRYSWPGE